MSDLSFIHADEGVEKEINGTTLKFYPLSFPTMFKLRGLGLNLTRAFAAFQTSRQPNTNHQTESIVDPEGGSMEKFQVTAATVEHIREKMALTEQALQQIIEVFTAGPNWDGLCLAFADSLRDLRAETGKSSGDLSKEFKEMDLYTAFQMLRGLLDANMKQFGGVGEAMSQVLNQGLEDLTGTMTPDGSSSKTDTSSASSPDAPEIFSTI